MIRVNVVQAVSSILAYFERKEIEENFCLR